MITDSFEYHSTDKTIQGHYHFALLIQCCFINSQLAAQWFTEHTAISTATTDDNAIV